MSVAGDILTDVLSKLSTALGATFVEIPDLFNLENVSSRHLDNGYSAILLGGDNGQNQNTSFHTITRDLEIKIVYRTYTTPAGTKAKTVLQTLYTNEQTIINLITRYSSPPTGFVQIIDPVTTEVETIVLEEDSYLVNKLVFTVVYRFAFS